jgi:hypothetical protein
MINLIFNSSDGSFHMASSNVNKFYINNDDFVAVHVTDFDTDYSYSLIDNEVVKGDIITLSADEVAQMEADVLATAHHTPRILAFPSLGEQLDLLYHDIENNKLDKTGEFYKAIKTIKDAIPKNIA